MTSQRRLCFRRCSETPSYLLILLRRNEFPWPRDRCGIDLRRARRMGAGHGVGTPGRSTLLHTPVGSLRRRSQVRTLRRRLPAAPALLCFQPMLAAVAKKGPIVPWESFRLLRVLSPDGFDQVTGLQRSLDFLEMQQKERIRFRSRGLLPLDTVIGCSHRGYNPLSVLPLEKLRGRAREERSGDDYRREITEQKLLRFFSRRAPRAFARASPSAFGGACLPVPGDICIVRRRMSLLRPWRDAGSPPARHFCALCCHFRSFRAKVSRLCRRSDRL